MVTMVIMLAALVFASVTFQAQAIADPPRNQPGVPEPVTFNEHIAPMVESHMTPTGKPESVQVSVGLYFAETAPARVPSMLRLDSQRIDIPGGVAHYESSDSYVLPVDVEVLRIQPHAHHLARRIEGIARLPDGTTEWLIDIQDWDFKWQDVYEYARPLALPAGTTLTMRYTYDNSAANARNPHRPPRRVTFGQTTSSEMGDLWLQVMTRSASDRMTLDRDYAPRMLQEDIAGVEKALEITPDAARLHADLGLCYIEAGRILDALASLQRSVRLDPRSASAQYDLGTLLLRERRYTDCRASRPANNRRCCSSSTLKKRMMAALTSSVSAARPASGAACPSPSRARRESSWWVRTSASGEAVQIQTGDFLAYHPLVVHQSQERCLDLDVKALFEIVGKVSSIRCAHKRFQGRQQRALAREPSGPVRP
jgi:hypothetical protein